jgi:hypothetical protein
MSTKSLRRTPGPAIHVLDQVLLRVPTGLKRLNLLTQSQSKAQGQHTPGPTLHGQVVPHQGRVSRQVQVPKHRLIAVQNQHLQAVAQSLHGPIQSQVLHQQGDVVEPPVKQDHKGQTVRQPGVPRDPVAGQAPQADQAAGQAPQADQAVEQVLQADQAAGQAPQADQAVEQAPQADQAAGQVLQADQAAGQAPQADQAVEQVLQADQAVPADPVDRGEEVPEVAPDVN